ncbi:MAG: ATP-binding protein [Deltaproteobacteria bacterium]|nr:ATP-binding protein [Deltaproteobacteria bacterium]
MKPDFIETSNTKKFEEICEELTSSSSLVGPSLAQVTGPAGRGKSEAAKHYAVNSTAIYIPPMNIRTPAMVLREISFELAGVRPSRSDACLNVIGEEMAKSRRLIMIDEADLLQMACLEMLRNVNERFACPIMLIGEEELKGKLGSRRRISSRIRRRMEFGPIGQHDIAYFLKTSLGIKAGPDVTSAINKHANGDWRPVLTASIGIERAMKASNVKEITVEMVNDVIKNN